jgi:hypothetical protein
MENMDKKECGCGEGKCMCGGAMGHMHGCHGKYHLVKVILKLVIIIIIFWCGFSLGQITGSIRAGYGRAGAGMMLRGGYNLPVNGGSTVVTPATPTP